MPHFRVKIGKMHHFCLNLEILGGGPGSRLLIGVVVVKLTLEGGVLLYNWYWILNHILLKITRYILEVN